MNTALRRIVFEINQDFIAPFLHRQASREINGVGDRGSCQFIDHHTLGLSVDTRCPTEKGPGRGVPRAMRGKIETAYVSRIWLS